jgi:hypothetical protein
LPQQRLQTIFFPEGLSMAGVPWPFTVDSGVIACNYPSSAVVFFTSEKIYAVDEVAKGMRRYADVREILR